MEGTMKGVYTLVLIISSAGLAWSQDVPTTVADSGPEILETPLQSLVECRPQARAPLQSNRNFPDFIGFMTNPLQAIDPRSLTQIQPLFLSSWWNPSGSLPGGNAQVYGPAISLALTDRFSVGLNQGGYAVINYNPVEIPLPRLQERINDFRGTHSGWINLGGYAQYTLIENVPEQFLFTVGARLEVPTGESSVYQGHGQPSLSPYFTFGKGWGNFHVLNTTGYSVTLGKARESTDSF
jgi:hypothetical protein